MKKHNLFKVLLIVLLVVMVASYFISARGNDVSFLAFAKGTAKPLGFGDVGIYFAQSFYHFFDTILFVFVVGAFYTLLDKVPAYNEMVNSVAKKCNSKVFIIIMTIVFALLASLTGMNIVLFIFIPLVVAIILAMGYDKLVALFTTVGATLVGSIGGIFLTFRDPSNSYYGVTYTTFDKFLDLDGNYATIVPRIILLVLGVTLLIFFILRYLKKNDKSYELNESTKNTVTKTSENNKASLWPFLILGIVLLRYFTVIFDAFVKVPNWFGIVCNCVLFVVLVFLLIIFRKTKVSGKVMLNVILGCMLVFLILGLMPWDSLFNIKVFDTIHEQVIKDFTLGSFSSYESVISSNFVAFGQWGTWGNFLMPIVLIFFTSLVIKFAYRIKFDDVFDSYVDGFKKLVPAALLIASAYTVLVCSYNNGFMETVYTAVGNNAFVQLLVSLFGMVFSVDLFYTVSSTFNPIMQVVKENGKILSVGFQSLYGLVQLIGPTSLLLIIGLTYFDVSYKNWVKNIWRFVLAMFVIIFVILLILALV